MREEEEIIQNLINSFFLFQQNPFAIEIHMMLSRNIVISLVTGSILGFSVSLLTLHMMGDTNIGLQTSNIIKNVSVHREEEARDLTRKVRVLCWIMTQPENHKLKVRLAIFVNIIHIRCLVHLRLSM